ncbi:MAG: uroporphyrinogen-III synthase [Gammaproteobacteria bacterium]|nr:uroporphyrinogen-III synthase [Gammaproteobacteria bacterium]
MRHLFLVLRPQPGADETVAALAAAGIEALALPVLGREALAEDAAMRASIQALAENRLVIFVSPAAVEFGMALIDRYWPQYPVTVHWVAVGERTRQALAAWGVKALTPADEDERSEGLLALPELQAVAEEKVLIMRGRGGRELLADSLRERGARVSFLELYERVPLPVTLPEPGLLAGMVVTSVAVLQALLASGGEALKAVPMIVPSERVMEAARQAGFHHVCCAHGAGPAATVAAIASLAEGEGR